MYLLLVPFDTLSAFRFFSLCSRPYVAVNKVFDVMVIVWTRPLEVVFIVWTILLEVVFIVWTILFEFVFIV